MSGYQKVQQQTQQKKANKVQEKPDKRARQTAAPERLMQDPNSLSAEDVISAQQQVGNQTVQRALGHPLAREESTDSQGNLQPEISNEIQQARGSGTTLPGEVQKEVAGSFGKDFSHVRIHTDDKADKLSRQINARAFTIGSDIFFKKGVFAPSSSRGRDTLLHELTHVVQQAGSKSSGGSLKLGAVGSSHEQEAEHTAKRLANRPQKLSAAGGGATVQKQDEEEVQMQGEEEEVKMQGEEEEVQMQPESSGVVQRSLPELVGELTKKLTPKKKQEELDDRANRTHELMGKLEKGKEGSDEFKLAEKELRTFHKSGILRKNPATLALEKRAKAKKETEETEKSQAKQSIKKFKSDIRRGDPLAVNSWRSGEMAKEKRAKSVSGGKAPEKAPDPQEARRTELLNTIKDPKSDHSKVTEAEAELRKYHKRTLKSNYSSDAINERRKTLKAKAKEGDKDAQSKYEALKKSNPTKGAQFKSFMGKAGKAAGGFVTGTVLPGLKSMLGSSLGTATSNTKTLLSGPGVKPEGEGKDAEKGGGEGKKGGATIGDSGMVGAIVHLTEEIATLKGQIAGLKGSKSEEPVK